MRDDEIKAFLKAYQPVPPAQKDPEGSLRQLLATLGLDRKTYSLPLRIGFAAAMAASFVAVIITFNTATNVTDIVSVETSEEIDLFEEELPTLEVGEGYLDLIAVNRD